MMPETSTSPCINSIIWIFPEKYQESYRYRIDFFMFIFRTRYDVSECIPARLFTRFQLSISRLMITRRNKNYLLLVYGARLQRTELHAWVKWHRVVSYCPPNNDAHYESICWYNKRSSKRILLKSIDYKSRSDNK